MKLWIDDIRTPTDDTWHICRSVSAAIRALDMYWMDVTDINLDHDISHQVVVGKMSRPYPCEETFEIVARYIVRLKQINNNGIGYTHDEIKVWNPKITLQTANPTGADNMQNLLEKVGLTVERKIVAGANRLEMNL